MFWNRDIKILVSKSGLHFYVGSEIWVQQRKSSEVPGLENPGDEWWVQTYVSKTSLEKNFKEDSSKGIFVLKKQNINDSKTGQWLRKGGTGKVCEKGWE